MSRKKSIKVPITPAVIKWARKNAKLSIKKAVKRSGGLKLILLLGRTEHFSLQCLRQGKPQSLQKTSGSILLARTAKGLAFVENK